MQLMSEDPPLDYVRLRTVPKVGTCWQHHSGPIYNIISITNKHAYKDAKFPLMVTYEDKDGHHWSRLVTEFLKKFTFKNDPASVVMQLNSGVYDFSSQVPYDNRKVAFMEPDAKQWRTGFLDDLLFEESNGTVWQISELSYWFYLPELPQSS